MVSAALLVRVEAKRGKEAAVAEFLEGALALVRDEPGTTAWFALRFGPATFGIFDAFPDEAGRQAHLAGRVAEALAARADELFVAHPTITRVDVLASKLPG
ncbi:putative quinol monooxygenase [Rhodococcus sp. SGAir0479]|uniref:putative quinol monooxygenase n=1 Tax=Rhodococcus sp. SGAir0479 TaxID=2567884 RepID=UPI0010CD2D5E|nr:antibiotic biosynthesis monooxygenase [Rhodococcus sp. SGAir0479]QCQ91561.1 antibiotic biosynthesis monooxygenase [Rhodococcus sp. SGAir0479]